MLLASHSEELQLEPFRYCVIRQALTPELAAAVLHWLQTSAPWRLRIESFYEQYEFSLQDAVVPASLNSILSPSAFAGLRRRVETVFRTPLADRLDVTAHKLVHGQRIRIHNDFIPGQESHRLLVQLNDGWLDKNGGALMFFNSQDPSDVHRVLRPLHNTGVLFEISARSLHAVSPIHSGERFTLVFSFYRAEQCETRPTTSEAA